MFCISVQGQTDVNGHTPVFHSCGSEPSMGTAGMQQESGMGREIQPQCQPDGSSTKLLCGHGERKAPKHNSPPINPGRVP